MNRQVLAATVIAAVALAVLASLTGAHQLIADTSSESSDTVQASNTSPPLETNQIRAAQLQLPSLPGQHPWPLRGHDRQRSGFTPNTGPETPVIEPPEWPFDQVDGDVEADPVVDAGGTVYFGSTNGTFYALHPSAATTAGLPKWTFEADGPVRSAAAIKSSLHGDDPVRIYFTTENGHVHSVNPQGNLVWAHPLQTPVDGRSAPALANVPGSNLRRVYLATSSGVYALEESGDPISPTVNLLWHEPSVQSSRSVAVSTDGDRVYTTANGTLYVLDANNGQVLDQITLEGDLTGPVLDENEQVYVGSAIGGGALNVVNGGSSLSLVTQESYTGQIEHEPALAPDERIAFVSGDVLHMVHRSLITHTWRFTSSVQSPPWQFASEIAVDGAGTVFVGGSDSMARAIHAGSQAWSVNVSGNQYTAPALTRDGRMYVGTDDSSLHAIQTDPSHKIAFDGDIQEAGTLDIYTIRSAYGTTGTVKRITDNPAADTRPAYSTLGQWLAFVSDRDSPVLNVFLGTASGSSLRNLTTQSAGTPFSNETDAKDPAFTPTDQQDRSMLSDGKHYLAVTTGFDFNWALYFIDLDALFSNGNVTGVNLNAFLSNQGATNVSGQVPSDQAQAAFSPDGRFLAYGTCIDTSTGPEYQLRVVDLFNDSETTPVAETTDDCSLSASFHPFFSPDSRYLVYESGSELYVTGNMSQPGTMITPQFLPEIDPGSFAPAWSPDGTEIVYHDSEQEFDPELGPTFTQELYALYGSQYMSQTLISPDSSSDGTYHPRRLPEPETQIARCNAQDTLTPTSQQPGKLVTIRGCGFDIRFPQNNTVIFPRADGNGVARTEAIDTAVEFDTGLGIITAEVPYVAGDGQIAVDTPFGASQSLADPFHIEPLATDLRMDSTIPNAYIRVMGYGFETRDIDSYEVQFTGASASPVTPTEIRLETCQAPDTPCSLSQLASGEIGWLSVQVPENVSPGSVTVQRTFDSTVARSSPSDQLTLLDPEVSLSRYTGSAGDPAANLDPVEFDFTGSGFPYDPYFNYTQVDLYQVDPDPQVQDSNLGTAALDASNNFARADRTVHPNSGGTLTMEARLPYSQTSGTLASASTPFTTPMKDLPIVFVPGTSGSFIQNTSDSTIKGRLCGSRIALSAIVGGTAGGPLAAFAAAASSAILGHGRSDYGAGENIWVSGHGLTHIVTGCANWLDAIHLNPNNNNAPSKYSAVQMGEVMKTVDLPAGMDDMVIYADLFNYMEQTMGREIVEYGDACSGTDPCVYLFNEDWRKDMESQAQRLDSLVNKALNETGEDRVAIVTQSYGGPTTQYYLRSVSGAADKVDQVISLGGGFMGVIKPYKILEMGSSWGVTVGGMFEWLKLKRNKPQQMARDWPTAYWQLPQSNWFDDPNDICPRTGQNNSRDCTWVTASWDAEDGPHGSHQSGPGALDTAADTYSFIEDATALHPFKGRVLAKFYPNINNSSGQVKHPIAGVYQRGDSYSDKFGTARNNLLDLSSGNNEATLSCADSQNAGLGDWRCGTQGTFFHRIVGYGRKTHVQVQFTSDRICTPEITIGNFKVAGICWHVRNIEVEKSTEGDGTIPLRSAVGILEPDGTFDSHDSRVWAIDGSNGKDWNEDPNAEADDVELHTGMPRIYSVHRFIRYAVAGKLTDITQLPSDQNQDWPTNTKWPLKSPCGVPDQPNDIPRDKNCSQDPRSGQAAGQGQPSYWVVELSSDAQLHVRDAEGQHAGPIPGAEGLVDSFPEIDYDADPGRSQAWLPYDSGVYTFTIEGDEAGALEGTSLEIADLEIFPEGGQAGSQLHIFQGLPISRSTTAKLVWDTGDPAEEPVLRFDYGGNDEFVELTPDANLTGPAATDSLPPTTTIQVDDERLTINATDEGGAGVYQVYFGTDRGQSQAQVYTEPVDLPADTSYVWSIALDNAGNSQSQATVYRTCRLPMDFDGNGTVEGVDVERAASHWLADRFPSFNLNVEGPVDVGDIQRTVAGLGTSCPDSLPAAPEPVSQETEASLQISSPLTVTVDETFSIRITVEEPEDVAALEAALVYAPDVLEIVDVSLGDAWSRSGRTPALLGPRDGSLLTDGNHPLFLGVYSTGEESGLNQSGIVIEVTARATAAGSSPLALTSAHLADTAGTLSEPGLDDVAVEAVGESTHDIYVPSIRNESQTGRRSETEFELYVPEITSR